MAIADHSPRQKEDEDAEEETSACNPPPPPSEVFDSSITVDPSYIISLIRGLLPCSKRSENDLHKEDKVDYIFNKNLNNGMHQDAQNGFVNGSEIPLLEDKWEDNGCILWDLSVDENHADLMVENLMLDVLHSTLAVTSSVRIREICIGIIANLACHEAPMKIISSRHELIDAIIKQLFLDDSPCLSETCRLLTLGIQGCGTVYWAEALKSEDVLSRILWIAGNTLNSQLLEKCLEFLLAILENENGEVRAFLPPLMDLGLPTLLVSLLSSEMNILVNERKHERFSIVDLILCAIEAISVIDKYSQVISSNKELFSFLLGLVKLSDKSEVGSACVVAVVILANILSDEPDLVLVLSEDVIFLEGLLDTLPFTSDDSQAQSAYWNVLTKVLVKIEERVSNESSTKMQSHYAVLLNKSDLIMENVFKHHTDKPNDDEKLFNGSARETNLQTTSLAKIASIIEEVILSRAEKSNEDLDQRDGDWKAQELLGYCRKYI